MLARIERLALKYLISYFVLYGPVVLSSLGFAGVPPYWYDWLWQVPVRALASVLGLHALPVVPPNPSSDGFQVAQVILFAIIAGIATLIWSRRDRHRAYAPVSIEPRPEGLLPLAPENDRLYQWLRIGMRYLLAYGMLHFGIAILCRFHPGAPTVEELVTPLGQLEPYEMLNAWLGWNPVYTSFVGITEILGGAFLLRRKTTLLGVMWAGVILSNVIQLNFLFDVPGKSLAPHFTLITGLLLLPDALRIFRIHFLGKSAPPANLGLGVPSGFLQHHRTAIKSVLISLMVLSPLVLIIRARGYVVPGSPHQLSGLYTVKEYQRDGEPIVAIVGDSTRWRYAILTRDAKVFRVQTMDGGWLAFNAKVDTMTHRLTLTGQREGNWRISAPDGVKGARADTLKLFAPEQGKVRLRGPFLGHEIEIALERFDPNRFRLLGSSY
jgi:hypothetical protein